MQNDVNFRNVVRLEDGCYDCEIEHPIFGWIPFTANPNDVEAHGRTIWMAIHNTQE
jgi:hypothetical protein